MASSYSVCEPCLRGDRHSIGYSWCSDCEEILCEDCDKAHRVLKLTLSHHLVSLKELPKDPISLSDIRFCKMHPDTVLDGYCTFHDELCCKVCLLEKHRGCKTIKTLEEASIDIQSSVLYEDVAHRIPDLLKTIEVVKEERILNRGEIIREEQVIKDDISAFKQDLLDRLNKIEESHLVNLETLKAESLSNIDGDLNEFDKIRDDLLKSKSDWDFTVKHGSRSKLFLLMETLKQKITDYENEMQNILTNAKRFKIDFKSNISNLESVLESFSSLKLSTIPCSFPQDSIVRKSAQVVQSTLKLDFKCFLSLSEKSAITGIEITKEKELLLCDWQNDRMLIFNEDCSFQSQPEINGDPYGIVVTPDQNNALVTMPETKCIQFFYLKSRQFAQRVSVKDAYYGIRIDGQTLIVGAKGKVDMLSMNGTHIRTLPYQNNYDFIRFIRVKEDHSILLTDSKKLQCLSENGTNMFEFPSQAARGLELDRSGHIYVADKLKKSVSRISPDGQQASVLLDETDSIGEPLAIRFSQDFSQLFVGSNQSKLLAVFNCKWI